MSLDVFKGFDYEPNEIENEIFLSDVPLQLMEENIKLQFQEPLEHRKNDLVQTFLNNFIYTKNTMTEDDEYDVENINAKFISFMCEMFSTYLGIGLPTIEDMSEEQQQELIHYIYRFFIINIKRNFVNLILNYIEENKEYICENLPKKKDVTVLSLKKVVTDIDDITIISNLPEVIKNIFNDPTIHDVETFLSMCEFGESNLEAEYINEHYDSFDITGDFTEKYCDMIDEDFKVNIECRVRNKILKKYKK